MKVVCAKAEFIFCVTAGDAVACAAPFARGSRELARNR
jgi:hypothetical protein